MNWTSLVSAAFGLLLGGFIQYLSGQRAEARRHRREKCADAYAEYLRAIAAAARLRSDDDLVEYLKAFAAAKSRIVVYGSRAVVEALIGFEEAGADTSSAEGRAALLAVCHAMRAENQDSRLSDSELRVLLLDGKRDDSAPPKVGASKPPG